MSTYPDRRHTMYDLDESWLRYMKADREERKKMCEDFLAADAIAYLVCFVALAIGGVIALCKGWI